MQRRDFIKFACSTSALVALPPTAMGAQPTPWRTFRLTYHITLPESQSPAKLWLPLPDTQATSYQTAMGSAWSGTASRGELHDTPADSPPLYYGEWSSDAPRQVTVLSHVRTLDRAVALDPATLPRHAPIPANIRFYLKPTHHMPNDGIVRSTALEITRGVKTPLGKARAIYDWIVDNTFRDPKVQGCGRGDIKFMLESGDLGGKCADINSLFVGLARAVGIPAREKFGIRVAESKAFKSLGRTGDVSKAQHCRAEFYLAGLGWVPVDPADVRKAVLEEKLNLDDPKVVALREKLFGAWEMNWVAFNHARDFTLRPRATNSHMNFFMYPYAEEDGLSRDSLNADGFAYRIEAETLLV